MQRFGYKVRAILLIVFVSYVSTACATTDENGCRQHSEKEMGQLATFVRVSMDIVTSEYMGEATPPSLTEEKIEALIKQRGTPFKEIDLLRKYDLLMISQAGQWAAVAWDPENDQKLLQDLRCTKVLDDPTWRTCRRGHEFTLDWNKCN